ncbi:MAG: transcriptional repressor [Pseudomonadaceae bacterium]|nr:transcriptional repressor [Pseudomonadaceae bacterium]
MHQQFDVAKRAGRNPDARDLLRASSLRCTGPRLAVLTMLAEQQRPLTCSDATRQLGPTGCDPATVYRTLVTLADVGLARIVNGVDGKTHYELASADAVVSADHDHTHQHAHFVCVTCTTVTCLAAISSVEICADDAWARAAANAQMQLHGVCPECELIGNE